MPKLGVIRVNISVPKELKARMDLSADQVNWSKVACQAFQAKLLHVERQASLDWNDLARNAAKDAHENNFPSRRGLYVVEGTCIVYYDNNPVQLPREKDQREERISEFRAYLKRSKITERGCAYYPTSGKEKDYTFAMVLQAEPYLLKAIWYCASEIFVKGWHEVVELGHPADGDTRRYTIPLAVLASGRRPLTQNASSPSKVAAR